MKRLTVTVSGALVAEGKANNFDMQGFGVLIGAMGSCPVNNDLLIHPQTAMAKNVLRILMPGSV